MGYTQTDANLVSSIGDLGLYETDILFHFRILSINLTDRSRCFSNGQIFWWLTLRFNV
jgi:hypothetical protein